MLRLYGRVEIRVLNVRYAGRTGYRVLYASGRFPVQSLIDGKLCALHKMLSSAISHTQQTEPLDLLNKLLLNTYHARMQGRPLAAAATAPVSRRVISSSSSSSSPEKEQEKESYTARQAKTGRPVSPHVTIYDFPPAALSSIANRVTGVALVAGERSRRWSSVRSRPCCVVDEWFLGHFLIPHAKMRLLNVRKVVACKTTYSSERQVVICLLSSIHRFSGATCCSHHSLVEGPFGGNTIWTSGP